MNKPASRTRHLIKIETERLKPAFWTVACAISLVVNVALIVALLLLGGQVFKIKQILTNQVLGGLYANFQLMDQASIQTSVKVSSTIPVQFDLPVKTNTTVTLTQDTAISGARVNLSTGGLSITSAPADIVLPAGTRLPISLDISVPVNAQVPVQLDVPVDIPLNQTQLHAPFVGLQQVVAPYYQLLQSQPNSWGDLWCGVPGKTWCKALLK
jgi:hypothetical protein